MDEKKCSKCGETKPLDEFHKSKTCKDGRVGSCKACQYSEQRARLRGREAEVAAYNRAYQKANRDRIAEQKRAYYNATKDRREANREALRAQARAYHDRNREKRNAFGRASKRANPHWTWVAGYRRRCQKLGIDPVIEDFTKADVIERYGDRCAYCGTAPFEHLDHAIPVSKGGQHTLGNARPSCAGCNLAKSDMTEAEWLAEQAELDDLTEDELEAAIDAEIDRWTQPKESK